MVEKRNYPVEEVRRVEERRELGTGGRLLSVCLALVVGLPLVGIGAGVAVVLFRGITGL